MSEQLLLECKGVEKRYKDTHALKPTNLMIKKGNIYGLIGRNGAGKTTLLKLLNRQLLPTDGEIIYYGKELNSLSKDFQFYYNKQRCKMILELASHRYSHWNKELEKKLLSEFQFPIKKTYDKISRGLQNILSIIITLCSNTDLLLFDEPYTGLDPVNRELVYQEIIRQNIDDNKTIILSSHLVTELESVINNCILIEKGEMFINDELEKVKEKSYRIIGNEEKLPILLKDKNIISKKSLGRLLTVDIYDTFSMEELRNIKDMGFEVSSLDLQQLMISLTTRKGV